MRNHDVIIVGGGGAGLAAALEAADAGARVLVVEAGAALGGTTRRSSGVYYAAGTTLQKARGHGDDGPAAMYAYYLAVNQGRIVPAIARRLCDDAPASFEWLQSLGVVFRPEDLYSSCLGGVPRGHKPLEYGRGIVAALEAGVRKRGAIDVLASARAERLLVDGASGAVTGVRAGGRDIAAPAVVLTTGGLGHSRAMLAQYFPEVMEHADWVWAISGEHCRGDAIRLARPLGAAIDGQGFGHLSLTPNFARKLERGGRQGWFVLVNRLGRRFVDENLIEYVKSKVIRWQPGRVAYAIFDEETRAAMLPQPDMAFSPELFADNWAGDRVRALADAGRIACVDTLEELGDALGILEPAALANTIAAFNAGVAAGRDEAFGRTPASLRAVATPPFYGAEIRPAVVSMTFAGPRVDWRARVLNVAERAIPGLYAAGEAAGSVMGEQYIGGGISITNCVVYGRIAGREAAAFARSN